MADGLRQAEAGARAERAVLPPVADPDGFKLELGLLLGGGPTALCSIGGRPAVVTTLTASPVDHRKVVRAQEVAVRCRIPILYYLPGGLPANTPVRILEAAAILLEVGELFP